MPDETAVPKSARDRCTEADWHAAAVEEARQDLIVRAAVAEAAELRGAVRLERFHAAGSIGGLVAAAAVVVLAVRAVRR